MSVRAHSWLRDAGRVRWPAWLLLAGLLVVAWGGVSPGLARAAAFQRGDVFLSGGSGIQELSPAGVLQQTIPGTSTAAVACFDASGSHLIVPGVGLFDASGNALASRWATVPTLGTTRCVSDAFGNVYLSGVSAEIATINKYNVTGKLLKTYTFPFQGVAPLAIDIAPDECTLYYGSSAGLADGGQYNVCTNTAGPQTTFVSSFTDDLRVLPNWDLLTVSDPGASLSDPTGQNTLESYSPGMFHATSYRTESLDPDGTSFWLCCAYPPNPPQGSPMDIYRLDIASGTVLASWPAQGGLLGVYSPPLTGDANVEASADSSAQGTAEAFTTTAGASGPLTHLHLWVNAGSTATRAVIGVYSGARQHPGTLLQQATITNLRDGSWNDVDIPAISVTAGHRYWIAVLAPKGGGTLSFRDGNAGGRSVASSQHNLTALAATWSTGKRRSTGPLSAYGS
jgi:hypothetical protein